MTEPAEISISPVRGNLIESMLEKPIGIGLLVGVLAGSLNAIILNLTIIPSMIVGAALGILVCLVACPRMRAFLKRRKFLLAQYTNGLSARSRRAFTSLD